MAHAAPPARLLDSLFQGVRTAWRPRLRPSPEQNNYESLALDDLDLDETTSSSSSSVTLTSPTLLPTTSHRTLTSKTKRARRTWFKSRTSKIVLALLITVPLCIYLPRLLSILHLYTDAGSTEKFRPSYIPNPRSLEDTVPPVRQPPSSSPPLSLDDLQNELAARYIALGMPADDDPLRCTSLSTPATLSRYSHLQSTSSSSPGRTLIALNLYNSAPVLPSISRALLSLSSFLGPSSTFISIFENGSSDQTPTALAHLGAVLSAAGVRHRVLSDGERTPGGVDRIEQLAVYRNVVMEPLYESANSTSTEGEVPFTNVLFINDVYFCPTDALELLHVRRAQDAHATCGLDYRWRSNPLEWLTGTGPKVRFPSRSPIPFLPSLFVSHSISMALS